METCEAQLLVPLQAEREDDVRYLMCGKLSSCEIHLHRKKAKG